MRILRAIWVARIPSLAFMVIGIFLGSFAASVPDLKAGLGVNDAVFGMLLLANGVGLVASMWLAPLVDRWLGARSLQTAAALFALTLPLPALMGTPWAFAVAMVGVGAMSGFCDILMNARVSELEAAHRRPLMNCAHGMFSVAYAVAAFWTGLLRDAEQAPIVALSIAAVLSLMLATRLYMPIGEVSEEESAAASGMPWGIVLICGLIVLSAFMTEATVETWSALHIERTLGGDPLAGALGPVMLGLTMAVGRLGGQDLSERFSDAKVIVIASLLASSGLFIAAAAPTPLVAYIGFGILGLGVSVIGPLGIALAGRLVPARHRTEAISKAAVMGFSGFFIAPVLMGGISEITSLRVAYAVVGVFVLSAIVLVWRLRRAVGSDALSAERG